jgi:cytochrome o ubiquinol oxidase subunit 2
MSSFWIPQLGSQIYAMAAMQTQLELEASSIGEYTGKDTEINGAGYAGMTFLAKSTSQADFDAWVASVQNSTSAYPVLDMNTYNTLAEPSENNAAAYYSSYDKDLYDTILIKYMVPEATGTTAMPANMPGMTM